MVCRTHPFHSPILPKWALLLCSPIWLQPTSVPGGGAGYLSQMRLTAAPEVLCLTSELGSVCAIPPVVPSGAPAIPPPATPLVHDPTERTKRPLRMAIGQTPMSPPRTSARTCASSASRRPMRWCSCRAPRTPRGRVLPPSCPPAPSGGSKTHPQNIFPTCCCRVNLRSQTPPYRFFLVCSIAVRHPICFLRVK